MTNLAIECSGTAGSVALYDGKTQLALFHLNPDLGSVQTLAHQIQFIVRQFGTPTLMSITHGPGSFTGLRVGLATAKMLALAWKIPIVAVDTLQAIALRAAQHSPISPPESIYIPVINAFRKQVFSAAIQFTPNIFQFAQSQVIEAAVWQASPLEALLAESSANTQSALNSRPIFLCGPGMLCFADSLSSLAHLQIAPKSVWNPTAAEVALIGWEKYQLDLVEDAYSLQPLYIRASAAEEQAKLS